MRFVNNTNNATVDRAIKIAEELLKPDSKMMLDLMVKNDWKYDSGDGIAVVSKIQAPKAPIEVNFYKPWNRWSSAIGYFDGKAIFINIRKFPFMYIDDIVANLCHEYMHYVGFHHGNNYKTEEKCLYSVPYFVSENIKLWI